MLDRDLKTLAEIGRALLGRCGPIARHRSRTLSAVSLLNLPDDRTFERASAVLLDRAVRQGMASATREATEARVFEQPFFRLFPEERFLLAALHLGRWSYARCARVMEETPERIERLAWRARVRLAPGTGIYPMGGKVAGPNCPAYDPERPWTQRFLDEEIRAGNELLFLRNHMMACDSCRGSLNRCRDLYFAVDGMIPRVEDGDEGIRALGAAWSESRVLLRKNKVTFAGSLASLFKQRDVQLVLAVALGFAAYLLTRR